MLLCGIAGGALHGMTTRYELIKAFVSMGETFVSLDMELEDFYNAEIFASVLRLQRKGCSRDEAYTIAAEWHKLEKEKVSTICEFLSEPINKLLEIRKRFVYDEGEDEDPEDL